MVSYGIYSSYYRLQERFIDRHRDMNIFLIFIETGTESNRKRERKRESVRATYLFQGDNW